MSRKMIGVTLVVLVLAGVVVLARAWAARPAPPPAEGAAPAKAEEDDGTAVTPYTPPEFPRNAEWVQGKPVQLAGLRGRVAVVHFWTNGCSNCIHNYPVYRSWQEQYAGKDVTIVGVHTPEFDWEAPAERVRTKARDNRLTFPIVLDTGGGIWNRWGNHYWPSIYLIDRQGRVRYHWDGELHLDTAAGKRFAGRLDELLAEKP